MANSDVMANPTPMNPKKFFGELKRRNVYKVAVASVTERVGSY